MDTDQRAPEMSVLSLDARSKALAGIILILFCPEILIKIQALTEPGIANIETPIKKSHDFKSCFVKGGCAGLGRS